MLRSSWRLARCKSTLKGPDDLGRHIGCADIDAHMMWGRYVHLMSVNTPSWLMALEMPAQSHAVMQESLKLNPRFDKMHKRFFDNTYIDYAGCWWKDAFFCTEGSRCLKTLNESFQTILLSSKQDAFFPFDSDPRRLKVALRWCCPRRLSPRDLDHGWMARTQYGQIILTQDGLILIDELELWWSLSPQYLILQGLGVTAPLQY